MRKVYFITRFDNETHESIVICCASSEAKAVAWVQFYQHANKSVYYYNKQYDMYTWKYAFTYSVGYMHTELPDQLKEDDLPF